MIGTGCNWVYSEYYCIIILASRYVFVSYAYHLFAFVCGLLFVWNQIVSVIFQSRERCNGIASTFLVPTGAALLNRQPKYSFFNEYDILIWNTTIQNCNAISFKHILRVDKKLPQIQVAFGLTVVLVFWKYIDFSIFSSIY